MWVFFGGEPDNLLPLMVSHWCQDQCSAALDGVGKPHPSIRMRRGATERCRIVGPSLF